MAVFGGFGCTAFRWWLRSPGNNSNNAAYVNNNGWVNVNGNNVNNDNIGVRPLCPDPNCLKPCPALGRSARWGKGTKSPLAGNGGKTHAGGKEDAEPGGGFTPPVIHFFHMRGGT